MSVCTTGIVDIDDVALTSQTLGVMLVYGNSDMVLLGGHTNTYRCIYTFIICGLWCVVKTLNMRKGSTVGV